MMSFLPTTKDEYGVSVVDSGYVRPGLDAIHLIVDGGRAILVDTGINSAIPRIALALNEQGLSWQEVDYIFLTHVHLDHAGGAGQLMRLCHHAKLTVHPRGARHMIDPSRLWSATVAVYGEKHAYEMYGEIPPIPDGRIIQTPEGHEIVWQSRRFHFMDAPGHALHHVCIEDSLSHYWFVGDCFGLAYPELNIGGKRFTFPTTSPSQFDPMALHKTIDRIVTANASGLYLTHYGWVGDVPRLAEDMHHLIDAHVDLANGVNEQDISQEARHTALKQGIRGIIQAESLRQGWGVSEDRLRSIFIADEELNAQGLGIWLDTRSLVRSQ